MLTSPFDFIFFISNSQFFVLNVCLVTFYHVGISLWGIILVDMNDIITKFLSNPDVYFTFSAGICYYFKFFGCSYLIIKIIHGNWTLQDLNVWHWSTLGNNHTLWVIGVPFHPVWISDCKFKPVSSTQSLCYHIWAKTGVILM